MKKIIAASIALLFIGILPLKAQTLKETFAKLEQGYISASPIRDLPHHDNKFIPYKTFVKEFRIGNEVPVDLYTFAFLDPSNHHYEKIDKAVLIHYPYTFEKNYGYLKILLPNEYYDHTKNLIRDRKFWATGNVSIVKRAWDTFCTVSEGYAGRKKICIKSVKFGYRTDYIIKIKFWSNVSTQDKVKLNRIPKILYGKFTSEDIENANNPKK
jgi:hypothetical protein